MEAEFYIPPTHNLPTSSCKDLGIRHNRPLTLADIQ
jgi:hypothetical protein